MSPDRLEIASALISVFEGPEHLKAFQDPGGVWTIGRGHTGKDVIPGLEISHNRSLELFDKDEEHLIVMVADKPPWGAAAYISFGYNCGYGALSAVLNGMGTILDPRHTTDRRGHVLAGLVSRRKLEHLMVESGL